MESQRMLLFMIAALLIFMIWQAWVTEQQPAPQPVNATAPASPTAGAVPTAPTGAPTPGATAATPAATPAETGAPLSGQRIVVTTDLLRVELDTQGGDLRRADLLRHAVAGDQPDTPFRLLDDTGELHILQNGLIGSGEHYPNHNVVYRAEAGEYTLSPGRDSIQVPLHWTAPDGVRYTKTFTFHRDSYVVDVTFSVVNASAQAWQGYQYAQLVRARPTDEGGLGFMNVAPSFSGAAIFTPEDRFQKISFDDMVDEPLQRDTRGGWAAMLQHYFVNAWLPGSEQAIQLFTRASPDGIYKVGYKTLEPVDVGPGATGTLGARLFTGPKEQVRLREVADGMVLSVDYGWLTPISAPLFWVLQKINRVVGNWGWAIVLLTLLIKLVFYPLSAAGYKSMAKMRKLQPRLQTLKERFGDDRQQMNQAMMELYKTEKINPLGGCLPILVQIPVFIALYWVLLESVELRQAPFTLWIQDLSAADPYFVLPILMGISMFAQQMLNPAPLDPIQKKVMMALPVVFTVFFLFFPAGLVLYWLANNVLSIAQQWRITHVIEHGGR